MKKLVLITFLIAIFIFSFSYSGYQMYSKRADIAIQLSEIFQRIALPYHMLRLSTLEPDTELLVPVYGIALRDIADTWGDARSNGRTHEGVDIFAARDTPIFSATEGYVIRSGTNTLGGNIIFVTGKGGVRYYYAHLDSIAQGIEVGTKVTTDTVLGFVGNTGNAETTPPHLHFGMYINGAQNPFGLLKDR